MAKRYTIEQIEWLKDNVERKTYSSLTELTNAFNRCFTEDRSESAISTKIGKDMGMKLNTGNPFTEEEKEWLIENRRKYLIKELCKKHNEIFPERTEHALLTYLSREKLSMKYWSKEEEEWVRENYYNYDSMEDLLEEFNKNFDRHRSLKGFALHCQKKLKLQWHIPFSEKEKEWIKNNVDNYTHDDLSTEFNKKFNRNTTYHSIQTYCFRNGIKKQIPEKFFSKPVGSTTTKAGYTYIKTKEVDYSDQDTRKRNMKTYEPLARVIWKQHYGDIPEDCQIIFLDSNKENFDINNLYCIPKKYLTYMRRNNWFSTNPELTLTAIKWCELMYSTQE